MQWHILDLVSWRTKPGAELDQYLRCVSALGLHCPPGFVVYRAAGASASPKTLRAGLSSALRKVVEAATCTERLYVRRWDAAGHPAAERRLLVVAGRDGLRATARRLAAIVGAWTRLASFSVTVQLLPAGHHPTIVCTTRNPLTGSRQVKITHTTAGGMLPSSILPAVGGDDGWLRPRLLTRLATLAAAVERALGLAAEMRLLWTTDGPLLLGVREAQLGPAAALRMAAEMVGCKVWSKVRAVNAVSPGHLEALLRPTARGRELDRLEHFCVGQGVSPGVATGKAFVSLAAARNARDAGHRVALFAADLDMGAIEPGERFDAVVLLGGTLLTPAAAWARREAVPMVAAARELVVRHDGVRAQGRSVAEGAWVTVDGTAGRVFVGEPRLYRRPVPVSVRKLLTWADEIRAASGLEILANADDAQSVRRGLALGASGVGLCRTERMLTHSSRTGLLAAFATATPGPATHAARRRLEHAYRLEFLGLFRACRGRPLTVRLLDPSLGELGATDPRQSSLRGCRVGIVRPELYDIQVKALFAAAYRHRSSGGQAHPAILLPQVNAAAEVRLTRDRVLAIRDRYAAEAGWAPQCPVGAMIETPRGALAAGAIACEADFLCFGTNDLTQYTLGLPRAGLPVRAREDPFRHLDRTAVLALMKEACTRARRGRSGIRVGVCGEHAGDPASVLRMLEEDLRIHYLSCRPAHLAVTRLAAGQTRGRGFP